MPVLFSESEIKRTEGQWTALPEDIDIDPELNGRHDLPDITEMVKSILTHGQLQPVPIRRCDGRPKLIAGFTRFRAVAHINENHLYEGPEPLRLICTYRQTTDRQAFLANIEENRMRNATTSIDDAYNLQKLINVWQMTPAQAADVYHSTVAWVNGRLQLLELAPEAEKAVRAKRVAAPAVKALSKLSRDNQKKVLAKEGPITLADVKAVTPAAPKESPKPNLRDAVRTLLDELDAQKVPAAMVMPFDIHRDTLKTVREAL